MDDPYVDSRSSRRVWEDQPRGPFGVNEPLPKIVQLWKKQVNKVTNKPQELMHFAWQWNSAQRILESLPWSSTPMSGRSKLSRLVNVLTSLTADRGIALSTFEMSRNKTLLPFALELRAMDLTREVDNTAAQSVLRQVSNR
jgi:hypothetical protein